MVFPSITKFHLGRVVITPAVLCGVPVDDICRAIDRHVCGIWGDVPDLVRVTNESGLMNSGYLLSTHHTVGGIELRVLTTADRLTTTVHLPDEFWQQRTLEWTPTELSWITKNPAK